MTRTTTRAVFSVGCILIGVALLSYYQLEFSGLATGGKYAVAESATEGGEFSWDKLPTRKELIWESCYEGRDCARLLVPLNYSEPDGRQASIALVRKPAVVPKESAFYRGPVLFNPGGPGGSGVDMVVRAGDLLTTILGPQFDIVGFDPRGIARSTPAALLFKTDVERELWIRAPEVVNNSDEGIARAWARATVLGQLAAETDDGYLRHINTENTARDMLRIVQAHGQSKLQYWGFSYGSVLGASFAAIFPDKVERLIIDGVVDSENYYATLWSNNLLDTDKTMESFFTGCAEAGPEGCAFWAPMAADIQQNLTTLYNSLRTNPIPMRTKAGYGLLDYSMLRSAIFGALYSPYATFPVLAQALAELAAGDGQKLFDSANPPLFQCSCDGSRGIDHTVYDALATVMCNDGADVPGDLKSTEEYFEMLSEASSWAEIWADLRLNCVNWPRFPKDHFQGPFRANTSHPILLIGNTADPVTPLWAAKKMSTGFAGSVVLTQDSPGHCSMAAPSVCTQKYIRDYFVDGTLPEPGTVCQAIGTPFPASGPLSEDGENEAVLMSNMSPEDQEIYAAISQLSKDANIVPQFHGRRSFAPIVAGGGACKM